MKILRWPTGRPFVRAHPHLFGSTEFDHRGPGLSHARFAPVVIDGDVVPVIHAGTDDRTASAETIFHLLPTGDRPRRVFRTEYATWQWSTIAPTRDLELLTIDADHPDAPLLVDGDASSYANSRTVAVQLLADAPAADGLAWPSRQLHTRPSTIRLDDDFTDASIMLVAPTATRRGGLDREELTSNTPAVLFASDTGLERLLSVGQELDVDVISA